MREIAVDFVYSLKTKRRFNRHAKCTVWVSPKLTSLLLAVRKSTVVTAPKQVKMITSTHNLLSSSQYKKVVHFVSVFFLFLFLISCIGKFAPLEKPREIAFTPSVLKRVQRWRTSWIRSIVLAAWKRPPQNICYTLEDYVSYCYGYWSSGDHEKHATLTLPLYPASSGFSRPEAALRRATVCFSIEHARPCDAYVKWRMASLPLDSQETLATLDTTTRRQRKIFKKQNKTNKQTNKQ